MSSNDVRSHRLGTLLADAGEYGRQSGEAISAANGGGGGPHRSRGADIGTWLATIVSAVALAFSAFSFYETSIKQAELRVYQPPLIYMYRKDFRDVFAIPMTISNDGAQRGTVLSFDLEVTHLKTNATMRFQNLHFGATPRGDVRLFTPMTIPGNGSVTEVVLFHALETGSFVETTGGVELPLRLTLKLNQDDPGGWPALRQPSPVTFDMTASYIASHQNMEAGRPTQLHDSRWTAGGKAKAPTIPPAPDQKR